MSNVSFRNRIYKLLYRTVKVQSHRNSKFYFKLDFQFSHVNSFQGSQEKRMKYPTLETILFVLCFLFHFRMGIMKVFLTQIYIFFCIERVILISSVYGVIKIAFVIIFLMCLYFFHKKSVIFILSYNVDMRQVDSAVVLMAGHRVNDLHGTIQSNMQHLEPR